MFKKLIILAVLVFISVPVFAQSVDTVWVRRYNGPLDYAYAGEIAVDGSGNVYVTGMSSGSGTMLDYATIKYYPNGDTAWVRTYNGTADGDDVSTAISVDGGGNVYVTGWCKSTVGSTDYATIKYYSNGETAWVRLYDGLANSWDVASAIAVDGSGNVYVTGMSSGSGTMLDYATIKYYPDGDTAWVRRYNGPGNLEDDAHTLAVDDSGYVYVTGSSGGTGTSQDYATIKYYPNGNMAWLRRYNGPANSDDFAHVLAVDYSGNVYVTGWSNGDTTSYDYATVGYTKDGTELWVQRYNGPGNGLDVARNIAVDDSESVYVTGYSEGDTTCYDYATIKYYPNGDTAWVRRYNGPGNFMDNARAIAIDNSNNVYVTGSSCKIDWFDSWDSLNYATIKYYPNGDIGWVKWYGYHYDDVPSALAVDRFGNVYVTGESEDSLRMPGYATIKYVQFLRGDANKDDKVSLSDIVYLINYLFKFGPAPEPIQAGDVNCDGKVSLGDIVYLVNYLFKFGPAPCS